MIRRINITDKVVPACFPLENDDQEIELQGGLWTAGLGAINSVSSPGGKIRHIFPFQMKETQLQIQVRVAYKKNKILMNTSSQVVTASGLMEKKLSFLDLMLYVPCL